MHSNVAAGILPAVEGGILPPGAAPMCLRDGHSAGQDARLYGRQDARRYSPYGQSPSLQSRVTSRMKPVTASKSIAR